MNAAIDQQCENYISENNLWYKVEEIQKSKFKNQNKPSYYNPSSPERLPDGNNGLGFKIIGLKW